MTGYDEAVAWFRERVGTTGPQDRDDSDWARHAATIVNAVLAEAVPAGRDLTAQDVTEMLERFGAAGPKRRMADVLNRIARGAPERGDAVSVHRCAVSAERGDDEPLPCTCDPGPESRDHREWCEQEYGPHAQCTVRIEWLEEQLAAGSLPAPPPEVTEALTYFGNQPQELEHIQYGERVAFFAGGHAATLVRWLISVTDEVTGDSAEQGEHRDWVQATAGGSRRSCVCGDRRDNDGVTHRTGGPCFQSPRSWSLPAPPPDDVTVVHVPDEVRGVSVAARFYRDEEGNWWGPGRDIWRWSQVLGVGTVVEGEPTAPQPQAAESVCDRMGHDSRDVYEGGEFSHSVCDECGAEMLPDLDDEPQAAEPDQCRYCPNDADRDEAGFLHCIECGWTDNSGKVVGLHETIDRLRAELAETRDRRDYLQGQLDIIYDAEYSRNDALKRRIEKMGAAGDALAVVLIGCRDILALVELTAAGEALVRRADEVSRAWRSVRGDAPTQPSVTAGVSIPPAVDTWQSDDGDWGWACARCDYRSVAWWSDRAVAERAAVEHGRDRCRAGGSAPVSTDGGVS